jgi:hypothetical protein
MRQPVSAVSKMATGQQIRTACCIITIWPDRPSRVSFAAVLWSAISGPVAGHDAAWYCAKSLRRYQKWRPCVHAGIVAMRRGQSPAMTAVGVAAAKVQFFQNASSPSGI